MLRSMYSGISGLKNFQTKLDVIANNIANVNTYGYKKGRVTFKDAMSQTISSAVSPQGNRGGINPKQVGLGSAIATIDRIDTEASMQSTGRSLDLAINGDGYFVLKEGDQYFYTRAGNFYLDENGTLVNFDGYKVQAFDANGNLGDVMVNVNAVLPSVATTGITLRGNLSSDANLNFAYSQQFEVVNGEGGTERIDMHFVKTNSDEWTVYFGNETEGDVPRLVLHFGNDGNVQQIQKYSPDPANPDTLLEEIVNSPSVQFQIPGVDRPYTFDLSSLTQLTGSNDAAVIPNGYTEGQLMSFSIGTSGEINGVYSNGMIRTLGYLAVAKFSNASGLQSTGGNLYQATVNSGDANIGIAGEGRGTILAEHLEMSNVDLSEEFTEMIVAQRAFQANTRIITTSDEILQELVNLKR